MLSLKEKRRIKSEEEFKASLKRDHKPNKLWTILNSSFIIWLLSAIVLGGLTSFYAAWQQSLKDEEAIHKLDLEIDARFEASERALPFGELQKAPYYPANFLLLPPGADKAIQPEFANRNIKSLLYELNAKLPIGEQGDTTLALVEIKHIENYWMNKELKDEQLKEFGEKVRRMHNSRWHWNKMHNRELHIYNRPYRWMMRVSAILLVLLIGAGVTGSVLLYRDSRRKRSMGITAK